LAVLNTVVLNVMAVALVAVFAIAIASRRLMVLLPLASVLSAVVFTTTAVSSCRRSSGSIIAGRRLTEFLDDTVFSMLGISSFLKD
jgi:hypothetical protein